MIPTTLEKNKEWKSADIVFCLEHVAERQQMWCAGSDFNVYQYDLSIEKPERQPFEGEGHTSYVTGMVRQDNTLITCGYDGQLCWWSIDERRLIRKVAAHERWGRAITRSPDGSRLYTVADDMLCKVWDASTGELLETLQEHALQTPNHYPSMLYAVAASPDGKWLATGDRVGHTAVWDTQSFEKIAELETPVMYTWDPRARRHSIGGIRSLAFSPDSNELAVGGIGKIGNIDHLGGPARLEVFDWRNAKQRLEIEDNKKKGLIEQIIWSPDQEWILTAGGDNNGFLTFYKAESGELLHQDGQNGHIHEVSVSPNFNELVVAAHERLTKWTMQSEPPAPEPDETPEEGGTSTETPEAAQETK